MFFDKFSFPSPPSPSPSTPPYPLPSTPPSPLPSPCRPILRRAQNAVEFWNNIIPYRKYKILAQQANCHYVAKNIPAAIFPKIPKKAVEFQANFQLLGTKKRGRLTSFFCDVQYRDRLSNTQQRDSNGGRSREQTEGRLLQSKIVGIDGRCGENLFSDTIAQQARIFA